LARPRVSGILFAFDPQSAGVPVFERMYSDIAWKYSSWFRPWRLFMCEVSIPDDKTVDMSTTETISVHAKKVSMDIEGMLFVHPS
jgi:hypothetical protein